jgi:hypothetical protein
MISPPPHDQARFHTGYASWEAYGKAREGPAKDPAYAKLIAHAPLPLLN